jgi:signal transduction histidine kinase
MAASADALSAASVPPAALAEVENKARQSAFLDLERRSLATSAATVLMALMHRFTPNQTAASVAILTWCVVVTAAFTVARFVVATQLHRLVPHGAARRVWVFAPVLLQVGTWAVLLSWAGIERRHLGTTTFLLATFGLSAVGVMIGHSAIPRLASAYIALLTVPFGTSLLVWGPTEAHGIGWGTLLFGAMLMTYLPRVARERRANLMSSFLLEERARALELARDAALQAAAAKDAFHANLSHEIRTPLNGLVGVVDRMKRSELSPEQRDLLVQLDRCGQSLLLILNDALDAVSLEAGKLKLRNEPFDPHALLAESVTLFQAQADAKGLPLRVQPASVDGSAPARVVGDAQRIRQVLQNLVGNAVKLTERGEVVVQSRIEERGADRVVLHVMVVDTGPGFHAADGPRLFERFSQLHPERRGGTGLGLAISRELVTAMGGAIRAESEGPGTGARFVVEVPLARGEPASKEGVWGRRVLVVDDDPLNLAIVRAYLEVLGCTVDRASNGLEAVELASRASYDTILMDCQMPGLDGLQATELIRQRGVATPIVACTALTDADLEARTRRAGMQGFILKPVSSASLLAALQSVG